MPSALSKKLNSLPTCTATFVEPMECLAVAKLPDSVRWLYEILCGGWRRRPGISVEAAAKRTSGQNDLSCARAWSMVTPSFNRPLIRTQSLERSSRPKASLGDRRDGKPKALSADEFRQMVEHIPEPFRTMCIVAMCMGLRVSEVLGLKWCDVDWEDMRMGIRQSYVYGITGAVKTPASEITTISEIKEFCGAPWPSK